MLQSKTFWILCRALKDFVQNEGEGRLTVQFEESHELCVCVCVCVGGRGMCGCCILGCVYFLTHMYQDSHCTARGIQCVRDMVIDIYTDCRFVCL